MKDERPSRMQVSSKEACVQNLQMFKRPFLGYDDEKGNCWSDAREFRERSVCLRSWKRSVDSWERPRACVCVCACLAGKYRMRAQKLRRRCKRQGVGVVLGVILAIKKKDNALAMTGGLCWLRRGRIREPAPAKLDVL